MSSPTYNFGIADDGMQKKFVKGVSGNATGLIEYVGKAQPGSPTSSALWQISKWTYDANGFLTDIKFAGNNSDFNYVMDAYAGYF